MNKEYLVQLVRRAQSGDRSAVEELSASLLVRLRVIGKHKGWWMSDTETDDVVQDTLMTFLEKIHEVRENPSAFVLRILAHKIGNELKLRRSRATAPISTVDVNGEGNTSSPIPLTSDVFGASPVWADHGLESKEELNAVLLVIGNMKPFCKTFFRSLLIGSSVNEIWLSAQKTEPGMNRSAFDKRIFDCRKNLREQLRELS